jgi:hypothetical protein
VTRPRAADDFPAIRARMNELRRERAQVLADGASSPAIEPRPDALGSRRAPADKQRPLSAILRTLARTRVT